MTSHQNDPGEGGPAEDRAPTGEDLAALIARLLEETQRNQKELAEASGVKYQTLNAWMNRTRGTSRVAPEPLRALADTLRGWGGDVTTKQVFESAGRPVPGPTDAEREARLLKIYRGLSARQQRSLIGIAEDMEAASRA
ncbi:helix-turn-helix domain-containing protein [Streptomyces sp. BH034]|uniref:helix-turn-helix domain-containing protein n=1 Tax=Streptomyces sp. BH034 TaxID=3402626 RepID=UPI003BB58D4A